MKFLLILSCSFAFTLAGNVDRHQGNNIGVGGGYQETDSSNSLDSSAGGKTRKFVSIFLGPEDSSSAESKVIRVPGGGGKNVNIIFVKTPSSSSQQKTEVILPEPAEQRNLVYVLLKKQDASDNIRIRRPQNTQPSKPEVYFIRYANKDKDSNGNANNDVPSGSIESAGFSISQSQSYGLPQ